MLCKPCQSQARGYRSLVLIHKPLHPFPHRPGGAAAAAAVVEFYELFCLVCC